MILFQGLLRSAESLGTRGGSVAGASKIKRGSGWVPGGEIAGREHRGSVDIQAEAYGSTPDKPCGFADCTFLRTDNKPSLLALKIEA